MKRKSVFCLILLLMLFIPKVVCAEDTIAPASEQEPPVSFRELASRLQVETKDPFGFRPGSLLTEKGLEDGLPEFFDLRKMDTDGDGGILYEGISVLAAHNTLNAEEYGPYGFLHITLRIWMSGSFHITYRFTGITSLSV